MSFGGGRRRALTLSLKSTAVYTRNKIKKADPLLHMQTTTLHSFYVSSASKSNTTDLTI